MTFLARGALLTVTLLLLGPPCLAASSAQPAANTRDAWQEETLLQLSELRKAQGDLKQEVTELRAEVAKLRAGGSGARGVTSLDLSSSQFPVLGDAKAQVAIVEFSDFQCPYCRKHVQTTLPSLTEKYVTSGKARYFFVDFPLSFHAQAADAAVAGACAHQQGAFWKMHDLLFENQNKLGKTLYPQLAQTLGLDKGKFQACLADATVRKRIDEHTTLGESMGVQGTPAFVIGRLKNGQLTDVKALSGARPVADFERVIEKYLEGS